MIRPPRPTEVEEHRVLSTIRQVCRENDARVNVISVDSPQPNELHIVAHYVLNVRRKRLERVCNGIMAVSGVTAVIFFLWPGLSSTAPDWSMTVGMMAVLFMPLGVLGIVLLPRPKLNCDLELAIEEELRVQGFRVEYGMWGRRVVRW